MIYIQIPNAHTYAQICPNPNPHTYAQIYPNPNAQMAQYTQIPNLPNVKFSNAQLINTQTPTLQKQVGCFNHRVVTMVADKLKRQWL